MTITDFLNEKFAVLFMCYADYSTFVKMLPDDMQIKFMQETYSNHVDFDRQGVFYNTKTRRFEGIDFTTTFNYKYVSDLCT